MASRGGRTSEIPLLSMQPASGVTAFQGWFRCVVSAVQGRSGGPCRRVSSEADPESSSIGKMSGVATSTLAQATPAPPSDLDEIAAAIPADLIDLRPEDLRVEAEFFSGLTRAPAHPKKPEPAPPAALEDAPNSPSADPVGSATWTYPPTETAPSASEISAGPPRQETPRFGLAPAATAPVLPPVSPDVPKIEIEPPSLRPPNREFQPVREVVLPATTVLAWSLFGLIGIATSFIAGLMVGHYFWRM